MPSTKLLFPGETTSPSAKPLPGGAHESCGSMEEDTTTVSDAGDSVEARGTQRMGAAAAVDAVASLPRMRRCPGCGHHYSDARFCPFDGQPLEAAPEWDPSADPLLGRTISGRYEVEGVVAEGGMGTVYRVRHIALGNTFAMKVLRRDLARETELASRLVDEARATAAIGHPNIVAVTDFGEIDRSTLPELRSLRLPYFVMELVGGQSLAEMLQAEGRIEPRRLADIVSQCAGALDAAHRAGIVHRDLKPDNIRVVRSDLGEDVAKVLDFGVAKIIGSSRRTRPGMVFGTPHYMSPEQGQGLPVDQRTDVYALGVILYECLAGRVPFAADSFMGVVTKHLYAQPEPIASADAAVLASVAMGCLEKRPEDRFANMSELVAAIERARTGVELPLKRGRRALRSAPSAAGAERAAGVPRASLAPRIAVVAVACAALALLAYGLSRPRSDPETAASAGVAPSLPSGPPALVVAPPTSRQAGAVDVATATSSAAVPGTSGPSVPVATVTNTTSAPRTTGVVAGGGTATKTRTVATPPPPPGGGDVVDPWRH